MEQRKGTHHRSISGRAVSDPCDFVHSDRRGWDLAYVVRPADTWLAPDLPKYNIKYAESRDGIAWETREVINIDYKSPEESRISRACVLEEDGIQKMWYCYAIHRTGYRMEYAEAPLRLDGFGFIRMDERVGIEPSEAGWDSQMIGYPNVFNHKDKKYMLYCGNGYGRGGFGYAVWKDEA
jgi:hypothetical protein